LVCLVTFYKYKDIHRGKSPYRFHPLGPAHVPLTMELK